MTDSPDFQKLRHERAIMLRKFIDAFSGGPVTGEKEVSVSICPPGCYCACPGGPCEHRFEEWKNFSDGSGGERVCALCGIGAMSHDVRVSS